MIIVFFGLSISSAWGNGHATLLRGLFRALYRDGHSVHFFEKDVPYYASHRDATEFPFVELHLYADFNDVRRLATKLLNRADVAVVTSYCPDGAIASNLVFESRAHRKLFYDMDTPVTLLRVERGEAVPYLPQSGLREFDLVLSYTGGETLSLLRKKLGARRTETLYGWVDPDAYTPRSAEPRYESDFSYLGTYSDDRHEMLDKLFLRPAAELSDKKFVIGGAMYPDCAVWPKNVRHFEHVTPREHCVFYSSSPVTLNITRGAMAAMGYCPSGRLFEAAACGTAVLSDWWTGLEEFFLPGNEILIAESAEGVMSHLNGQRADLVQVGNRARSRTLDCHTATIRARRFIQLVETSCEPASAPEWANAQGA